MSIIGAALLLLVCLICWASTLLGLPGNWFLIGAVAVYGLVVPSAPTQEIGTGAFVGLVVLAALGELVEFLAGAMGARKAGGSWRAAAMALAGSFIGGAAGVIIGVPVPVVGPVIAAILFASIGAFAGAVLGETWKGRRWVDRITVGRAAFWGRLFGTAGKLVIGAVMLVLVAVSLVY